MKKQPKITVGIVTRNRKKELQKAINSVLAQDVSDLEIVVVDNASKDGTVEFLEREYPDICLIKLKKNIGCPGGRNQIFLNCSGEYIVNLDDDGYLGKNSLKKIGETFDANPEIGVICLRQCYPGEAEPGDNDNLTPVETSNFFGGVSAFRHEMLKKTGAYPEDFFFFKEEEYLSLRILDAGYHIVFHPEIIMWHPPNKETIAQDTSRDYFRYRNPLLVVTRLFPGFLLWKYLLARLVSYGLSSLQRGSFSQYIKAIGFVLNSLPCTLKNRTPCRPQTVKKYFQARMVEGHMPKNT